MRTNRQRAVKDTGTRKKNSWQQDPLLRASPEVPGREVLWTDAGESSSARRLIESSTSAALPLYSDSHTLAFPRERSTFTLAALLLSHFLLTLQQQPAAAAVAPSSSSAGGVLAASPLDLLQRTWQRLLASTSGSGIPKAEPARGGYLAFLDNLGGLLSTSSSPSSSSAAATTSHFQRYLNAALSPFAASSPSTLKHQQAENYTILGLSLQAVYVTFFLGLLTALGLALLMSSSWTQRLSSWSGRFSPFGRGNQSPSSGDLDEGYSYITNDDIRRINGTNSTSAGGDASSPGRDTDVLLLKHKSVAYRVHFPAYSIERNELDVGEIRAQAAEKFDADPARVKLLFKGRNLKDDGMSAREATLKNNDVVMCVIGDGQVGGKEEDEGEAVGEGDSGDEDEEGQDSVTDGKPKRKRNRNRKKKGKRGGGAGASDKSSHPLPPIPPVSLPQTPMDKLNVIAQNFDDNLVPVCEKYIADPPSDPTKRDFEYKRLSETILAQVLLKLDGVETEGDTDARSRRKELVRSAQGWLSKLDAAHNK